MFIINEIVSLIIVIIIVITVCSLREDTNTAIASVSVVRKEEIITSHRSHTVPLRKLLVTPAGRSDDTSPYDLQIFRSKLRTKTSY